MQFTQNFSKISKRDAPTAGGKGASLGEMTQAGIPVPPGFVVLADAFEHFLEETDLSVEIDSILHKVNHQEMHTVEHASETVQSLILKAKIPKNIASEIKKEFKKLKTEYVAVRSSATAEDSSSAAWAGQLDSYLNTTEKSLLENVQKCWASLFTPRAIFYRFEKGLHDQKISVAVVVQKMVASESSGIAFSVHPVTEDRNQLIIEAGFGLGEAIVSGQITPDSYVVEKIPRRIIDKNINEQKKALYRNVTTSPARGEVPQSELLGRRGGSSEANIWRELGEKGKQQVLTDTEILELSELILKIEHHYDFPCDIEWAREGGRFYIVQSRPITTLGINELTKRDPLILLGAWNVLPLEAWRWFDTVAIEKLRNLTGIKIRVFTYVKEELHYQCVFEREINELRQDFERAKIEKEQVSYVTKIYDDFYREVPKLEKYLKKAEGQDFSKFSNKEIVKAIQSFADLWTAITTQIWYAVFLDIWYTFPDEHKAAKQIAAKARDHTGYLHERSNTTERKLYAEAAKRLSLDVKGINYLFPAEIIDALSKGTSYTKEIRRRKKFCVTASIEGEYKIYSDKKSRELFEQYEPPSVGTEAKRELLGTPACKGKVTGTVRIIRHDKDFDKFKNDEILVALQTMVHYLPIMKKSKAILTEFGGLTSHAAIVSRELNKPCIVGIKNLLASVKDGDLVEVDADAGVVRVLERAESEEAAISTPLRPTVKRNLSLFSVEAWEKGYRQFFEETWREQYDILFHYDGEKVNFYHTKPDFDHFKEVITERLIKDNKLFQKLNTTFVADVQYLQELLPKITAKNLEKLSNTIGRIMSFYIFIVSDAFMQEKPEAWKSRMMSEGILYTADERIELFLEKYLRRRKDPSLAHYLSLKEAKSLTTGSALKLSEISKRKQEYIWHEGKILTNVSFADYCRELGYVLPATNLSLEEVKSIEGQAAFKGKAKGTVRIVKNKGDLAKVKNGDVLVAVMTNATHLPSVHRASAIVTDEGGITCHAAIIARELKKLCIIGTKIATQVLRDGDLVEVDADAGVVRILKRSKK